MMVTNCTVTLQIVVKHSEHPPLMKGTSWTLAAPYKEQRHHRTPSESIANNYTPSAADLKLKELSKIKPPKISRGKYICLLSTKSPSPFCTMNCFYYVKYCGLVKHEVGKNEAKPQEGNYTTIASEIDL